MESSMNRKRLALTILSSVCLAASLLAETVPVSARNFGFSTAGGSGSTPTGPLQLYRKFWTELCWGLGGSDDEPNQFGGVRHIWFSRCRRRRRAINRVNQSLTLAEPTLQATDKET